MRAIVPALAAVIGVAVVGCSSQAVPSPKPAASGQPTAPANTVPANTVPANTVPANTAAGATTAPGDPAPASTAPASTRPPSTRPADARAAVRMPIGVYEPSENSSWAGVAAFGRQAGQPVSYVVTYLGGNDPFPYQLAQEAAAHRAELIVQLEPSMSMARVAAGADDAYLDSLAAQIRAYGHDVIVSWAAEANGDWYSWGAPHTSIADYRAAWAHVMSRFTGVRNVTWMATINRTYPSAAPTSDYVIPGVDMYGIDAYYTFRDDTFQTVLGQTIGQIKAVTDKPIMVSETGIGPVSGQVKSIPGLVAGILDNHLVGMVYFNANQGTASQYHQDWRLSPAALKALHAALSGG
jgi:mannan endo-1,4-beta-mannosidase